MAVQSSEGRFEDVFQDEIVQKFLDFDSFKRFARSSDGLCLNEYVLRQIIENHEGGVEEQKIKMLNTWIENKGGDATVMKIREIVCRYKKRDDDQMKDHQFINLDGGTFGFYKNHQLSSHDELFLGEQKSEATGRYFCEIKFHQRKKINLTNAKILSRLRNHVNVVSILHAGVHRADPHDFIFIAMDLSWTNTVRNMLEISERQGIPFNEFISMNLVRQFSKALAFIHSNNIIHCDLKPENLLLSADWSHVKVTNFRFSEIISNGELQTKKSIGTVGYRASEIHKARISLKSDVFSAGVIIAEIMSNGIHPFGENPYLQNHNIISNKNPDLGHLLVSRIKNLIKRTLEMDPKKRPTAADVLNEVQHCQTLSQTKNQQTTADQSAATSSMAQIQTPTAEELEQLQTSSQTKNQQTTADQSSETSPMAQLHCLPAKEVLNEVQHCQTSSQTKNQQTTADQSSASSSMTQLQSHTAKEVLNDVSFQQIQTSFQPENPRTIADQSLATISTAQLSTVDQAIAIIVFNESDSHLYSYKLSTQELSRMQEYPTSGIFTAVVSGKHIYILQQKKVYQLEYSDSEAKWNKMPSMRKDFDPSDVTLNGSKYICGENDSSTERYDAVPDRWDHICNINIGRHHHCVVATKDRIYSIGGRGMEGEHLKSVERFDEKSKKWEFVEPLPRSINEASAAVTENRMIYVADYEGVLCYDIQKNSWSEMKFWNQGPSWEPGFVKILAIDKELYIVTRIDNSDSHSKTAIYLIEPETSKMTLAQMLVGSKLCVRASLAVKFQP